MHVTSDDMDDATPPSVRAGGPGDQSLNHGFLSGFGFYCSGSTWISTRSSPGHDRNPTCSVLLLDLLSAR